MKMSNARHKVIAEYVLSMAEAMSLSHYKINVSQDYETKVRGAQVLAATQCLIDGMEMKIGFSRVFFDVDKETQRQTVCHELIHGPVDPFFQQVYGSSFIKEQFSVPTFTLFEEQGRSTMERMVDLLANGWAKLLPLPPKIPV